jgi:hypothetical protein
MGMTGEIAELVGVEQCAAGEHDFEELWVGGSLAIIVGDSKCRACGTRADEVKIGTGPAGTRPAPAVPAPAVASRLPQ